MSAKTQVTESHEDFDEMLSELLTAFLIAHIF